MLESKETSEVSFMETLTDGLESDSKLQHKDRKLKTEVGSLHRLRGKRLELQI